MFTKQSLTTALLILVAAVLLGCQAGSLANTPITPPIASATSASLPTQAEQPLSSSEATAAPTPALPATGPDRPQPKPLVLSDPEPDRIELFNYLRENLPAEYFGPRVQWLPDLYHQDLNGDGQADLAVFDGRLFVLLWGGNAYRKPFRVQALSNETDPTSTRVLFEDWTGDAVPEIVMDAMGTGSIGTGLGYGAWYRTLYHCRDERCYSVWEGSLKNITSDFNYGGLSYNNNQMTAIEDAQGRPAIRFLMSNVELYCCSFSKDPQEADSLSSQVSMLKVYSWNGSFFELNDDQISHNGFKVETLGQREASSTGGRSAQVVVLGSSPYEDNQNDVCALVVDGQRVGESFGCKRNFIDVRWQDVNEDGRQEVVATAFSGPIASDLEGETLSEEPCANQRLLVYDVTQNPAGLLADVSGCLVRPDFKNVRLEDVDQDGALEIVAYRHPDFMAWKGLPENRQDFIDPMFVDPHGEIVVYEWGGYGFFEAQITSAQ